MTKVFPCPSSSRHPAPFLRAPVLFNHFFLSGSCDRVHQLDLPYPVKGFHERIDSVVVSQYPVDYAATASDDLHRNPDQSIEKPTKLQPNKFVAVLPSAHQQREPCFSESRAKSPSPYPLKQIVDASAESLEGAAQETVEQGAAAKTDHWNGYNGLKSLGYRHRIVHKTATVEDNLLPLCHPLCHREAAPIKRWLTGTHQRVLSHEYLGYYVDEYTFRFNRRTSRYRGKLFYRLLQNEVALDAVSSQDIAKGVRGRNPRTQDLVGSPAKGIPHYSILS